MRKLTPFYNFGVYYRLVFAFLPLKIFFRFVGESLKHLGVPVQLNLVLGTRLSVTYNSADNDRSTRVVGSELAKCLSMYLASMRKYFTGFNLLEKCVKNVHGPDISSLETCTVELGNALDRIESDGGRHQTLAI